MFSSLCVHIEIFSSKFIMSKISDYGRTISMSQVGTG